MNPREPGMGMSTSEHAKSSRHFTMTIQQVGSALAVLGTMFLHSAGVPGAGAARGGRTAMNDLGMALLAGAARCLVLASLGVAICAASRRRGPAAVASAA